MPNKEINNEIGNGIKFAWAFDGLGGGTRIDDENISEEIRNVGLAWVHINDEEYEARQWIEREISYLDNIILDALLAEETHPRYLDHRDGLLLILRGVNLNPEEQPEDMVSLRVWVDQHRIITVERRPVHTITEIDQHLEQKTGPKNAGEFLTMLTAHLFDHIESTMIRLHDKLDTLEDILTEKPDSVKPTDVTQLRRAAMTFHRYIAPQRDVIGHLRRSEKSWFTEADRRDFSEDWDKISRMIEDIDFLRDRARIVYDELNSLSSRKTNDNLYLLSGITTIFIPMTFITGLLGMNVGGIPGAAHHDAFILVSAGTIGLGAFFAMIFKWMKWF